METFKIEIINNKVFDDYNEFYNEQMVSYSDEIFQTQNVGKSGYIYIGKYNINSLKFSYNDDNLVSEIKLKKWNGLGVQSECERILISHLLEGAYPTYILSGAMGSGKTSTANYAIDFIRDKVNKEGGVFVKINFNFNHGYSNISSANEILQKFKEELYEKLKVQTINYLLNTRDKIFRFIRYLDDKEKLQEMYASFFNFYDDARDINWDTLTKADQSRTLFNYIERFADIQKRIELIMRFFAFLKYDLQEDEYFILLYDNLDRLPPFGQQAIFDTVRSFNEISQVKCLIPLRRATLARVTNDDNDGSKSSYSHGYIHHHGHCATYVIKERLKYWIDNIDSSIISLNETKYLDALKRRILFLYEELSNDKSRLKEFFESLCGSSLRLGLFMANRLLINNVIKFDEVPEDKNVYLKALIIDRTTSQMIENSDEVINMFSSNDEFSLLPIRILQAVTKLSENHKRVRNQALLKKIKSFNKWTDEEIVDSFNYLLLVRRPLLWSDNVNHFNSIEEVNRNGNFSLTEIGDGYFSFLIYNLSYVQECFMSLFWRSKYIPRYIDYSDQYQRLDSIFKCLKELHRVDKEELSTNLDWFEFTNQKLSIDIITSIVTSIVRIVSNYNASNKKTDFLVEIQSFILVVLNEEHGYLHNLEEFYSYLLKVISESKQKNRNT